MPHRRAYFLRFSYDAEVLVKKLKVLRPFVRALKSRQAKHNSCKIFTTLLEITGDARWRLWAVVQKVLFRVCLNYYCPANTSSFQTGARLDELARYAYLISNS